MCVVSNIMDYGRRQWDAYPIAIGIAPSPFVVSPPPPLPTPEQWAEFLELVEKARKYDELTNQPDCEDPEKASWMARIEERLAALEQS